MQDLTSEGNSVLLQNIWSVSKNLDEFIFVLKEEKTLEKLLQLF